MRPLRLQRRWIPDQVRDDRGGEAGMTEGGLGRGLLPGLPFLLLAFSGTIPLLLLLRGPLPVSDPWSRRGRVGSGISLGRWGRVLIYGLLKDIFSWM